LSPKKFYSNLPEKRGWGGSDTMLVKKEKECRKNAVASRNGPGRKSSGSP